MPVPCKNRKCKAEEGFSIHGRCLKCGYQQYPSTALEARALRKKQKKEVVDAT